MSKRAAPDWKAEALRLEGVYFNRGRPLRAENVNDAASRAAALFEAIRLYDMRDKPMPA